MSKGTVSFLDYGVGNLQSVRNAVKKLGYTLTDVKSPQDIDNAEKLLFPGVGAFESAIKRLTQLNLIDALRRYVLAGKPYFGICIGMQVLFEGSEEAPEQKGLGVIPGIVKRFEATDVLSVPHIGWNNVRALNTGLIPANFDSKVYFVHSFRAEITDANREWCAAVTNYGGEFISAVQRGRVAASQFHPEKSSTAGLSILERFLSDSYLNVEPAPQREIPNAGLARRIVACLDVRSNDQGDLVVTKGDQYDVREKSEAQSKGDVRNLGKPVDLARRYYEEGADEITFLNITSFREGPLTDAPMLQVLKQTSEHVFVPLTIGGGIRDYTDPDGKIWTALDVADMYFRCGADKVSIGSDAVYAAEEFWSKKKMAPGKTSIEQISKIYGAQAVVISVDPRRVYVNSPDETSHAAVVAPEPGQNGEKYCWYQCTVKGGRESRDIDVVQLAMACEELGAGELLINSVDMDGQKKGFDIALIQQITKAVCIPVIASSGAGVPEHFSQVFKNTRSEAALAAGIFHRKEVAISDVKQHMQKEGIPTRVATQTL